MRMIVLPPWYAAFPVSCVYAYQLFQVKTLLALPIFPSLNTQLVCFSLEIYNCHFNEWVFIYALSVWFFPLGAGHCIEKYCNSFRVFQKYYFSQTLSQNKPVKTLVETTIFVFETHMDFLIHEFFPLTILVYCITVVLGIHRGFWNRTPVGKEAPLYYQ